MNRRDVSDQQGSRLVSSLPPQKPHTGHPNTDQRPIINGMLWITRTGAPWRAMPERYGKWTTLSSRFYRWEKAGIGQRILDTVPSQTTSQQRLAWESHDGEGSLVRAHQQAAGAKHSQAEREGLGRSQGGFSTKVPVRCAGKGKAMTFVLTAGPGHEAVVFEQLMIQAAGQRVAPGRPKQRPQRVVADKGYRSRQIRAYLRRRGIRHTLPHQVTEHRTGAFDRAIDRSRTIVERLINRLKQYRRSATRYEQRAENYLAMLLLAAIIIWL